MAALAGAQQLDGPGPAALATTTELEIREGVFEGFWEWRGYRIRYHRCGDSGPPAVLVHGERPPAATAAHVAGHAGCRNRAPAPALHASGPRAHAQALAATPTTGARTSPRWAGAAACGRSTY